MESGKWNKMDKFGKSSKLSNVTDMLICWHAVCYKRQFNHSYNYGGILLIPDC